MHTLRGIGAFIVTVLRIHRRHRRAVVQRFVAGAGCSRLIFAPLACSLARLARTSAARALKSGRGPRQRHFRPPSARPSGGVKKSILRLRRRRAHKHITSLGPARPAIGDLFASSAPLGCSSGVAAGSGAQVLAREHRLRGGGASGTRSGAHVLHACAVRTQRTNHVRGQSIHSANERTMTHSHTCSERSQSIGFTRRAIRVVV